MQTLRLFLLVNNIVYFYLPTYLSKRKIYLKGFIGLKPFLATIYLVFIGLEFLLKINQSENDNKFKINNYIISIVGLVIKLMLFSHDAGCFDGLRYIIFSSDCSLI